MKGGIYIKKPFSVVAFVSTRLGQRILKILLEYQKSAKIDLKCVVVCDDKRNPHYKPYKIDITRSFSKKNGIKVCLSPDELQETYDIGISVCNFHILKQKHIDLFRIGIFNIHGALKTKYKGSCSPAFHILESDFPQWGFTYHKISEGIDEGCIIKEVYFNLPEGFTSKDIDEMTAIEIVKDFPRFLDDILNGNFQEFKDTGNPKLRKRNELDGGEDTDIQMDNDELYKLIRAYDMPVVLKHPSIMINGMRVRMVPEKSYQEMLQVYRQNWEMYKDI